MRSARVANEEEVVAKLQALMDDPSKITEDSYTPNSALYPDNRISFMDRHLAYLRTHRYVAPDQYLSNLSLMISRR